MRVVRRCLANGNVTDCADVRPLALQQFLWLLSETFEPEQTAEATFLTACGNEVLIEVSTSPRALQRWCAADQRLLCLGMFKVGPRLNFTTAWSTNAVCIFHACGLKKVQRIERSRRFKFCFGVGYSPSREAFAALIHDRMTEMVYETPLNSFDSGAVCDPVTVVPNIEQGRSALQDINDKLGLAFDDWDLNYYTELFVEKLKRNPSDVECFDMAQSNSEHCRHWFFGGNMVIDGDKKEFTLFELVKQTLPEGKPNNSVLAFCDNSSAIRGGPVRTIYPEFVGQPSKFVEVTRTYNPILTAETHNFPTGVAPFNGAETGTGGRIRDVQATGTGALCMAGISSYCVGNLQVPGYVLPWEDPAFEYPSNLASPLDIEIQGSNGASDYGNKYGEPVVAGFTRSFGLRLPGGERREWVKPVMFSAGVGQMDSEHTVKGVPEKGMWVVKIGGPAYRIGMGGGTASSRVQDVKTAALDFNAVQRGDAEMENKMNRVVRACVELGAEAMNPIVSIHDQGAGGNGNVLKEITEPAGAVLEVRQLPVGDATLSVLEIWGAEYQENNALLLRQEHIDIFMHLCERENVLGSLLGQITGDGRFVLHDQQDDSTPVDLDLELVLGKMPRKTFTDASIAKKLLPLSLPEPSPSNIDEALRRVLRLLSVGSKRFLTTKVDRSVTGLVAQQQCVGPLHIPLADVAVLAQSHFATPGKQAPTGIAVSTGEQPIKGLLDAAAMARMSVGECLTNLVSARIAALEDVKLEVRISNNQKCDSADLTCAFFTGQLDVGGQIAGGGCCNVFSLRGNA